MAWTPISESGIAFTFNTDGGATLVGSVVTGGGASQEWTISSVAIANRMLRITVQSYLQDDFPGWAKAPASFLFKPIAGETSSVVNSIADDPVEAFAPDVFTGYGRAVEYQPAIREGEHLSYGDESYSFLIEVDPDWVSGSDPDPDPDPITDTVNCNCDDNTGNRTLAELRTSLMDALGFANPLSNVQTRTLAEIRGDMLNLLGWGANAANPGPGVVPTLNSFINEAQQTLARRLELDRGAASLPPRMTAESDPTTLDYQPVLTLAMAMACAHYAKPESKAYFEQHEKYVGDWANRRPPGLTAMLTGKLQEAQRTLLMRYPALRTVRFFSWPLTAGVHLYDLPDNQEACSKKLNPLRLKWVGVEVDGIWRPLRQGIAPELYSHPYTEGEPQRFEIRQCIEIWPTPSTTNGRLVIKGDFGIEPFAADTDKTTIDEHAVYLLAVANAKAHYRQPDAQSYFQQLEVYLGGLFAGTHGVKRYIPGHDQWPELVYTPPRTVEPLP